MLTCSHCADTIGIYEPLILLADGDIRQTSLAAEPGVASLPGEHYHRDCFALAHPPDQGSPASAEGQASSSS